MIQDILQLKKRVFIVAEIGKNFIQTKEDRPQEEYLENAKQLVKAAKDAGADAVKFQTHNVEDEQLDIPVTAPHFEGSDRYAWVKRNTEATPLEFWQELKAYSDSLGIMMFTTPMSRGAAERVAMLDFPIWKVGSADMLDFVLLDYLTQTGKPIIISTGMSTEAEIDHAVRFIRSRGAEFAIMHCVSKYPASVSELSLETIPYLAECFRALVGFSDHSTGTREAAAAVGMGARIIEKHLSLSRNLWGADHKVSLTSKEFADMVVAVREREQWAESSDAQPVRKQLAEGEDAFRPLFRKALAAACDVQSGVELSSDMLYAMRPQQYAGGLPSEEYENVLGKRTTKDLRKYDPITQDILQL